MLIHSHPFPGFGIPSEADYAMLEGLNQEASLIVARDGITQFLRK